MPDIIIKMKDGSIRKFLHEGRAGGSYTKSIKYDGVFAIVTDEWYKQTVIPSENILEIEIIPNAY